MTYVNGGGNNNDSFGFTVKDISGTPICANLRHHRQRSSDCYEAGQHRPDCERERHGDGDRAAELAYSDNGSAVNGPAANTIYTVTTLPTAGTLNLSGSPIALNGTFTQANINAGLVTYVNGGSTSNDSFGFTVMDVSGSPTAAQTFSITVHDQGTVTKLANTGLTVNENATATVTSSGSWRTPTTAALSTAQAR